jgi:hypothetical protein
MIRPTPDDRWRNKAKVDAAFVDGLAVIMDALPATCLRSRADPGAAMTDLTLLWSGPNGDAAGLPDRRSDAACIGKRPLAMNGSLRLCLRCWILAV